MAQELCWEQHGDDGAHCTLSKGHSGDHVACSGTVTNIIDAWRGDE